LSTPFSTQRRREEVAALVEHDGFGLEGGLGLELLGLGVALGALHLHLAVDNVHGVLQ